MDRALREFRVRGVKTNIPFLENLVNHPDFQAGETTTSFLEQTPEGLGTFDRVVMNPPFDRGADIRHVEHARTFLKPGGRLVAVVANGPRQRERLLPIASAWIDLPAGSFEDQGTSVNAAIVVIQT